MPRHRGPHPAGEQTEPIAQPGGDLRSGQHPQPGRRQFDGQRQAIKPTDDLHDHGDGVSSSTKSARAAAPWTSQFHRRIRRGAVGGRPDRRQAKWRDAGERLSGQTQRLPACGQHPDLWTPREDLRHQVGDAADQMLAVVDHQQGVSIGERLQDPFGRAYAESAVNSPSRIRASRRPSARAPPERWLPHP